MDPNVGRVSKSISLHFIIGKTVEIGKIVVRSKVPCDVLSQEHAWTNE